MVHLLPLPGSPSYRGSMAEVVDTAVSDAGLLVQSGFPSLLIENFGDSPFYPGSVPAETVAAMSVAVEAVISEWDAVVGINVLRNDARSALAVAAATGAAFIRVNVLAGTMFTDQGPIVGEAAEVLRSRRALCPSVEIWADVMVKHATPPPGSDPALLAGDILERSGADAVIVSGSGTGAKPDLETAGMIREAIGREARLVIGSGATVENLAELAGVADTVIVGSSLKHDGEAANQVDPERALAFVEAARTVGLL